MCEAHAANSGVIVRLRLVETKTRLAAAQRAGDIQMIGRVGNVNWFAQNYACYDVILSGNLVGARDRWLAGPLHHAEAVQQKEAAQQRRNAQFPRAGFGDKRFALIHMRPRKTWLLLSVRECTEGGEQ